MPWKSLVVALVLTILSLAALSELSAAPEPVVLQHISEAPELPLPLCLPKPAQLPPSSPTETLQPIPVPCPTITK
ncbi:hypothetical protein AB0H76_38875 [Nocardia sp. NPDC050712]|uniref:hypothetical protein n=1 Tax=Nocardia sp. NPDC050712 TaxID=3155518 RepID=UPI00341163F6